MAAIRRELRLAVKRMAQGDAPDRLEPLTVEDDGMPASFLDNEKRIGWWLRRVGGIPIRRHVRENVVEQSVALLKGARALALVVPAEATRGRTEYWRSGFYHIARAADVPIVLGFLDFARRRGGFGPAFRLLAAEPDPARAADRPPGSSAVRPAPAAGPPRPAAARPLVAGRPAALNSGVRART